MACTCSVHFDQQLLNHIKFRRNVEVNLILNKDLAKASNCRGTLLYHAAAVGNDDIVSQLLNMGSLIDSPGPDSRTPLMMAVERGSNTVRLLLEAGADINTVDAKNESALYKVLHMKYIDFEVVGVILLQARAETPMTEELIERLLVAGCTFPYFVLLQDVDILENLRGADINAPDYCSAGPLYYAAEGADADMLRFLLDHGANPDPEVRFIGQTPLDACFIIGENDAEKVRECAELLLERGAFTTRPCSLVEQVQFCYGDILRSSRLNCLVSHQAAIDAFEVPGCEEHLTSFVELKEYYDKCREILEVVVVGRTTVLHFLDEDRDYEVRLRARDQTFVRKVGQFCSQPTMKDSFSYYTNILRCQIAKAVRVVEMEKKASLAVCALFKCDYNLVSIFARQVVGYLSERDLEQLCRL